jgi:hypothetical protein
MKFNQFKYSTDSYSNESHTEPSVEKGHKNTLNIDLNHFEEVCKNFKEKKDVKISNLVEDDKENFELIVSYIHMLYGTEYYKHLYERVKKHFKGISTKPGTIGGYFAGCINGAKNNSLDIQAGCGIGCAGSMPLPQDEKGWNFCDKAVILAEKNNNGYTFSFLKPSQSEEDLNPAYVFVESNDQKFSGFSKEEKDYLKALGCNKVKLIGFSSNSDENVSYSEFTKEPKSVEEIELRSHKNKHHNNHIKNHKKNECNNWWIWLILILVILILLCFVCHKYKTSK